MTERAAVVARFVGSRVALPATLFVATAAVVSVGSWNVSIWTDEAVTISAANRSLPQLWELLQNIDAVHGLYYAFMSLWVGVFGVGEFWLRLPSALAYAGAVVGVLAIGRRLMSPTTALVAAVVCALLPRMTWAGIEARPFVFSALAAVWASWALVRAMERRRPGSWVVYAVLAALGVLLNIYVVLVVIGHGLTVLILHRRRRTVWLGYLIAAAGTAVAVSPLLLLVRSQQGQLGGDGDRSAVSIARKIVVNQLFLGETPAPDSLPATFGTAWQASALIAAAVGIGLMIVGIVRPSAPGDRRRTILALALPWLLLPTILIGAYAVLVAPIYQPRYFTFTAPAAALLIALGLRAIRRRWVSMTLAIVGIVAVLVVAVSQRTPFAKSGSDWAEAADAVEQGASVGDAVFFAPRYDDAGDDPVTLTARRIADSYPQAFLGLDDLTILETGAETASLDGFSARLREIDTALDEYDTVWMLYGTHYPQAVIDESTTIFEDAGFSGTTRWEGPGSVVVEFQRDR